MTYAELQWFLIGDRRTNAIAGHATAAVKLMADGDRHLGFFMIESQRQGTGFG
jgi:hypothetical protein